MTEKGVWQRKVFDRERCLAEKGILTEGGSMRDFIFYLLH